MVNKPPTYGDDLGMVYDIGFITLLTNSSNDTNGGNNNTNDHICKQTPAIQHNNTYNYDDCDISWPCLYQ